MKNMMRSYFFLLKSIIKENRKYIIWKFAITLMLGTLPIINIILFSSLYENIASNKYEWWNLAIEFSVFSLFSFIVRFLSLYLNGYLYNSVIYKIEKKIYAELLEIAYNIDFIKYYESDFYDKFDFISKNLKTSINTILESSFNLIQNFVSVFSLLILIQKYDLSILLVTFIYVGVVLIIQRKKKRMVISKQLGINKYSYLGLYLRLMLVDRGFIKELKTNQRAYGTVLNRNNNNLNDQLLFQKEEDKKMVLISGMELFLEILFNIMVVIMLIIPKQIGDNNLNRFVTMYPSVLQFTNSITNFLILIPIIMGEMDVIKKFDNLLITIPEPKTKVKTEINYIEIINLDYSYNNNIKIFRNFNLKLCKGNTLLIVGRNGSGKSTLILLLANLLKVKNGKIIINKKYDLNNYVFSDVSVLFQDYYLYPLTIKENLYFLKKKKIYDILGISEILKKHNIDEDVFLSNSHSETGINLSGGELKKIAIARVLLSDASLMIFDEPDNMLDEFTKNRLYNYLNEIKKRK